MKSETLFEEIERYVRFGSDDIARLAEFHTKAAPHFPRIATEFYERIREHAAAHAVFTSEEQIQRLQASLERWLHRICIGPRDADPRGRSDPVAQRACRG